MISAFSKKLDKAQLNYSATGKELLGLVKSIEHYRHYLLGREFELCTDHKALEYLKSVKDPAGRLLRMALILQEYKFNIKYIKGELNQADLFSRPKETPLEINNLNKNTCPDEKIRNDILNEYHIKSGHGSPNNMKFLFKEKYEWQNMFKEIDEFVSNCEICSKAGKKKVNNRNRIIYTSRLNEIWQCDLIGRIPEITGNNNYIFIALDHYSKWIGTMVLPDKCGKKIANSV